MEDFETVNLNNLLHLRLMQNDSIVNQNSFDPYKKMVDRNKQDDIKFLQYNKEDIEKLETFCKQHGILGINFNNTDPVSTLKMLKSKVGILEENVEKKLLFD